MAILIRKYHVDYFAVMSHGMVLEMTHVLTPFVAFALLAEETSLLAKEPR